MIFILRDRDQPFGVKIFINLVIQKRFYDLAVDRILFCRTVGNEYQWVVENQKQWYWMLTARWAVLSTVHITLCSKSHFSFGSVFPCWKGAIHINDTESSWYHHKRQWAWFKMDFSAILSNDAYPFKISSSMSAEFWSRAIAVIVIMITPSHRFRARYFSFAANLQQNNGKEKPPVCQQMSEQFSHHQDNIQIVFFISHICPTVAL